MILPCIQPIWLAQEVGTAPQATLNSKWWLHAYCLLLHAVHCPVLRSLSLSLAQVAKVSESDADYRKFYVESGATAMRLRAETKCAHGQGPAAA